MNYLRVITPPTVEPVTLSHAKAHCRVDSSDDDTLLTSLIVAARQWAENYCNRYFVQQTVELTLDAFPEGPLELPGGQVGAIVSIKYRDSDDVLQTWDSAEYVVDQASGRIESALGFVWPYARSRVGAAVVRYIVGYDNGQSPTDLAGSVPQAIRQAILMLVGHWYENRESAVVGTTAAEVPMGVEPLLWPYRILGA